MAQIKNLLSSGDHTYSQCLSAAASALDILAYTLQTLIRLEISNIVVGEECSSFEEP